jgi:hypothetical protein
VALSLNGNTLAVGTTNESSNATGIDGNQLDNSAGASGAVYVFARSLSGWAQQAYVKASNAEQFDGFGRAVALSSDGSTLAVGAFTEFSSATGVGGDSKNNTAAFAGAAYVFIRSGNTWTEQAYVKASNTEANDVFGASVSVSADGDTLVVGATGESSDATGVNGAQGNNLASGSGAAYLFTRSAGSWTQHSYIKASNTQASDEFGLSAALSGDGKTLAVGARWEASNATGVGGDQTNNATVGSGAVYVLTR